MMYPNQQPPMQGMANQMSQYGRYGDSMLVHMNPIEVQGLASLSPTGFSYRKPSYGTAGSIPSFPSAIAW
jgi:hypothetical protein